MWLRFVIPLIDKDTVFLTMRDDVHIECILVNLGVLVMFCFSLYLHDKVFVKTLVMDLVKPHFSFSFDISQRKTLFRPTEEI